jgi:hypothetical protein
VLIQKLTLNDRVLLLESRREARRVQRKIVAAVRHGGAFVKMQLLGGNSLKVLMSPGTVAYLDEFDVEEDEPFEFDEVAFHAWAYAAEFE